MSSPCRISFSNKCAYDFPLIAFQSQNTLYLILSLVLVLLLGFYEAWYKTVNGSLSTDLYVSPTLPVGFLLKNLRRARQTAPADGTPSTARRDTKQTKNNRGLPSTALITPNKAAAKNETDETSETKQTTGEY